MIEEITQAILMFIIAGSFGWLIGIALGTAAFGNPKLYRVKRERRHAIPIWRSGHGANDHE